MSYFNRLRAELDPLLAWADLRHEQGLDVSADVNRLQAEIESLGGALRAARPPEAYSRSHPNDLRGIGGARSAGPRKLWRRFCAQQYAHRLRGAWLARAAGCTLGAIVEGWSIDEMQALAESSGAHFPPTDYWPVAPMPYHVRYGMDNCRAYTRDGLRYVPVDDDLTYTLLGLLILEDSGSRFTTAHVAEAWLRYLPRACTAEAVALANLKAGVSWRKAAETNNPFVEWIGADIRADAWGYAAPGWPEKAAELAYRDAYLTHRFNGIYGAMFFAAAVSAAFAVDEPLEACRIALSEIPKTSRLHADLRWAFRQCSRLRDFGHARQLVDARFGGMHAVHTNNNACLTIFGLALGGRDVTKVLGNTVAMGLDNDCTAATAGSIVGACVGAAAVASHWHKPFRGKVRTYINGHEWFTVADIVRRFVRVAAQTWKP